MFQDVFGGAINKKNEKYRYLYLCNIDNTKFTVGQFIQLHYFSNNIWWNIILCSLYETLIIKYIFKEFIDIYYLISNTHTTIYLHLRDVANCHWKHY